MRCSMRSASRTSRCRSPPRKSGARCAMVDNRPFHYAILTSVALHAAVLFFALPNLLDPVWRAVQFPPPIIARLMEPEPVAPVTPLQAQPVPTIEKPKPKAAKPAPERSAEPEAVLAPTPMESPPQASDSASQASAEPVPAPPPLAAVRAAPAPAAPNPEETAEQL